MAKDPRGILTIPQVSSGPGAERLAQLPLPFPLEPSARFDTFVAGDNEALVAHLRSASTKGGEQPTTLWLWGEPSCGKSHLLQAACKGAHPGGAIYLPLRNLAEAAPGMLAGLESLSLVALDDVETVVGDPGWDRALFALFDTLHADGGRLVCAARRPPGALEFSLPDLASRASGAVVYHVAGLTDDDRLAALQTHARYRGIDLPERSARYLLRRVSRDMAGLCRWLDTLDHASLAAKRRLTIPFIRTTLGMQDG